MTEGNKIDALKIFHYDNPFAEVNDSEMTCTLEDVCIFFSAASSIPHMDWTKQPCLEFIHDGSVLPTSSTCSLILRLPTVHSTYKNFKESMLLGVKGNDGFGGP